LYDDIEYLIKKASFIISKHEKYKKMLLEEIQVHIKKRITCIEQKEFDEYKIKNIANGVNMN
jgi:hypothetical protein